MTYGTWLACLLARVVVGVDAELMQRLTPLWQRIVERVAVFFDPRTDARFDPRLRVGTRRVASRDGATDLGVCLQSL